jgi:phosphoserine phosphatase
LKNSWSVDGWSLLNKDIKVIVFDMDGVLVDIESSWDFVHKAFGINGRENFESYLRGEFDYQEFMRKDIGLWGRVHVDQIRKILDQVPFMKGTKVTVDIFRNNGYKTAIISSGLSILAEKLKRKLGLDYIFANNLLIDEEGFLTGEGNPVVGLWDKKRVLQSLLKILEMKPKHCAVVGDSVFDISLFDMVGFSIAFNSRDERVKKSADISIESKDLRTVLSHFKTNMVN